jgi:hypothetical protein
MHTRADEVVAAPLTRSRAAGRRRRLKRGAARFVQDIACRRLRVWGSFLVTFTTETAEHTQVQGQMRRVMTAIRNRWGEQDYFVWVELQERGAIHYHLMWLNPKPRMGDRWYKWITREWGLGRVNTSYRGKGWYQQHGLNYVLKYARKIGDKSYQQDYSEVPSSIRTFSCSRLEITPELLDEHRDRDHWVFISARRGLFDWAEAHLERRGFTIHQVHSVCALVHPGEYTSSRHSTTRLRQLLTAPSRQIDGRISTIEDISSWFDE